MNFTKEPDESPEEKAKRFGVPLMPYRPMAPQSGPKPTHVCGKCGFVFYEGQAVSMACPPDCPAGLGGY